MASGLSFTAFYTRRLIKWFAIAVVIYLILYVAWTIIEPMLQRSDPPPPIVPTQPVFSGPNFPEQDETIQFTYRLETISGTLPTNFPDRALIYFNKKRKPDFSSVTRAKRQAASAGFTTEPVSLILPVYQWRKNIGIPGILEMNSTNYVYDMVLNWQVEQDFLNVTSALTDNQVFGTVSKQMGAVAGGLPKDVSQGDHKLIYFKVKNGQLLEVNSISQADMVQVNFRRAAINEIPVVHANPLRPPMWGLMTRDNQVVELHYHYYPVGSESSPFPLRTVDNAWQDLLDGKAYLSRIGDNIPGQEVVIRDAQLAYYVSNDYQDYVQPVYVFYGDNDFQALVEAADRFVEINKAIEVE